MKGPGLFLEEGWLRGFPILVLSGYSDSVTGLRKLIKVEHEGNWEGRRE